MVGNKPVVKVGMEGREVTGIVRDKRQETKWEEKKKNKKQADLQ